jgi:hypothetical protein
MGNGKSMTPEKMARRGTYRKPELFWTGTCTQTTPTPHPKATPHHPTDETATPPNA